MARGSCGVGDTALALRTQRGTANGYLIALLRLVTSDLTASIIGYRICLGNIGVQPQAYLQDVHEVQARLAAFTLGCPIALKDHIAFLERVVQRARQLVARYTASLSRSSGCISSMPGRSGGQALGVELGGLHNLASVMT
jgi:hypothetical protein